MSIDRLLKACGYIETTPGVEPSEYDRDLALILNTDPPATPPRQGAPVIRRLWQRIVALWRGPTCPRCDAAGSCAECFYEHQW